MRLRSVALGALVVMSCSPEERAPDVGKTRSVAEAVPPYVAAPASVPSARSGHASSPSPAINTASELAQAQPNLLRFLEPKTLRDDAPNVTPANDGWKRDGAVAVSPGWRATQFKKFDYLAAQIPEHASDAREVGFGRFARFQLRITPAGACSASQLELHEGRAVYRDVWPSVDAVVVTSNVVYDELYVLRDENAPHEFTWNIELPKGIKEVKRAWDGGLLFNDARGEMVLHLPKPVAVDAGGAKVTLDINWREGRLAFEVLEGAAFPLLLDPALETATWEERIGHPLGNPTPPGIPSARAYHSMAYDESRQRTVLFGGTGSGGGETWEWDGTEWTERAPSTSPSARAFHAMAYDASRMRVVLFGGNYDLGDTWEWDGDEWTEFATAGSPSARSAHALTYDAERGRVVLFGGVATSVVLGDTWERSGSTWQEVLQADAGPAPRPEARRAHVLVHDSSKGRSFLWGGLDADAGDPLPSADAWEWDGAAWEAVSVAGPPARWGHAAVDDTNRNRVVLFGGCTSTTCTSGVSDTWEWDGAGWAETSPTRLPWGRLGHGLAFDKARARVVLHGGTDTADDYADTWEYYSYGGACVVDDDCDTQHCVDGVCCEVDSCGTCQICNGPTPGSCTALYNAEDADSCAPPNMCGPTGQCGLPIGEECDAPADCASTFCADGVCCDFACNAGCQVCAGATRGVQGATDGRCTTAPQGFEGAPSCSPFACDGTVATCPATCNTDDECGVGAFCSIGSQCRSFGAACAAESDCRQQDYCRDNVCSPDEQNGNMCMSDGDCLSDHCVAGICRECAADTDCPAERYCNDGSCVPDKANGVDCTNDAHCQSAHCAGGTCRECATDTDCSAADYCKGGTCSPDEENGANCAADAQCQSNHCVAGTCEECAETPDCAVDQYCMDGICTRDGALGAECATVDDCTSGVCEDGVCCDRACDGCEACSAALKGYGNDGTCEPVQRGLNPHGNCMSDADAVDICASEPFCDGRGGCGCAEAVCDADGQTKITASSTVDCAPFRCEGSPDGDCLEKCESSADCIAGARCDSRGQCTTTAEARESSGGCTLHSPRPGRGKTPWAIAAVMLLAMGRRRQRRPLLQHSV